VQAALKNLMQGRTVFVIAHRMSTVRSATRIVVLEDGRITQVGDHEHLMRQSGTYGGCTTCSSIRTAMSGSRRPSQPKLKFWKEYRSKQQTKTEEAARVNAAKPIYSMTGYATAQSTTEDGVAFTLTMKSVNHRFLDLNLRLPAIVTRWKSRCGG